MNSITPKVLILGLGYFEQELLRSLSENWQTIAVDHNEEKVESLRPDFPDTRFVVGDASSILTWKKLELDGVNYIIASFQDPDVSLEVCRITRENYKLDVPIIVILYQKMSDEAFRRYGALTVQPLELGITVIQSMIGKKYSRAVNIGQHRGEIVEVAVSAKSHMTDRRLSHLKPTRWHVAAIYREGQFMIPTGNSRMKVGDKVVLAGDPKVLENVIKILIQGVPQFPIQFGGAVGFPLHRRFSEGWREAAYWLEFSMARTMKVLPFPQTLPKALLDYQKRSDKPVEIENSISAFGELNQRVEDLGLWVIPYSKWSWLPGFKLKSIFDTCEKPVLLSRGTFPYNGILVSLNGPHPSMVLETAIEVAQLGGLEYRVIYAAMPPDLRDDEQERALADRQFIIKDFENIYKTKIKYDVLEGNPVRSTQAYLKNFENQLLVVDYHPGDSSSWLRPNVPHLIASKSRFSTLMIPGVTSDE